jgi:hypothetical protein
MAPKPPKGLSREDSLRWQRLNKTIADAGFWTISQPNVFPVLLAVSDPEIGSVMEGFGGIHVRFLEWREWLLPVAEVRMLNNTRTVVSTQQTGVSQVAIYEVI